MSHVEKAKWVWQNRHALFAVDKPYTKGDHKKQYKVYTHFTDISDNVAYFTGAKIDNLGCIWFRRVNDTDNIHTLLQSYLLTLKRNFKEEGEVKKIYPVL